MHCNAFAHQHWHNPFFDGRYDENLTRSDCSCCSSHTYWYRQKIIYPQINAFPIPNADLSEDIKSDYKEAANIASISPRGSAALLRLCIQKLCKQLGENGENINLDIASLVKKGLHPKVQQMLDYVRVVGNDAVHPGQIDIKDNPAIVIVLANLINNISEEMITKPNEIEKLYNSLPPKKLEGIKKRYV